MKYAAAGVLILILFGVFLFCLGVYTPADRNSTEPVVFLVKKGDTLTQISANLQERGLIKHKYFFIILATVQNKTKNLIAGEYELSKSMSGSDIFKKISSGDRMKKLITIIEGWTIKDIEEYLNMGKIDQDLEGYLFPDTYEIYPEDSLQDIVKKMRDNFDEKIKETDLGPKPLGEIITMASILEKEVRTLEDKKIVSGILWKRIDVKMPLQVDAEPDTYKYLGLPLKPICNPGIESIRAAINPVSSKYWFYLSTLEGKTIFSATLAEHEAAIRKYFKK